MTINPKNVLITGAAQRVGRAIAFDLAAHGYAVAVHFNGSQEDAARVCQEIVEKGGRAEAFRANLASDDGPADLVEAAADAMGGLGAVISSASTFEPDTALDFTAETWDLHIDVNLKAPLRLAQAFASRLPEGARGAIIHLLDQRVLKPTPQFFTYTLSKLALWQATTTLAQALAPRIRVNAVAPGPTLRNSRQSAEDFAAQVAATVLGTGSPPEDICAGVRYLLEAASVTGQTLTVDGGQHLIWQTPDVVGISE